MSAGTQAYSASVPAVLQHELSCPLHGETHVVLSRFRRLEELPGPHHPAIYRVEFACGCGHDHPGLLTHDELDWAPLGLEDGTTFINLMTSRSEPLGGELVERDPYPGVEFQSRRAYVFASKYGA